jgi:hypothetical protein
LTSVLTSVHRPLIKECSEVGWASCWPAFDQF